MKHWAVLHSITVFCCSITGFVAVLLGFVTVLLGFVAVLLAALLGFVAVLLGFVAVLLSFVAVLLAVLLGVVAVLLGFVAVLLGAESPATGADRHHRVCLHLLLHGGCSADTEALPRRPAAGCDHKVPRGCRHAQLHR